LIVLFDYISLKLFRKRYIITEYKNTLLSSWDCIVKQWKNKTILVSIFETSKRRETRTQFRNNFFVIYLPNNIFLIRKVFCNVLLCSFIFHFCSFFSYHLEENSNVCKLEREKERKNKKKSSYRSYKGCVKVALSDNSNRCSKYHWVHSWKKFRSRYGIAEISDFLMTFFDWAICQWTLHNYVSNFIAFRS